MKEVWGAGLEEGDEDIDAEMEREELEREELEREELEREELEREELERLTAEERIAEVGGVAAVMASLMAEAKKAKTMEELEVGSGSSSSLELVEGMDKGV